MIFNFNLRQLMVDYLPPVLRKTINLQYIGSILKPIINANTHFNSFQKDANRDSKMFGTVIQLEYYLNNHSLASYPVYVSDGSAQFDFLELFSKQDYIEDDATPKKWFFFDETDINLNQGVQEYLFSKMDQGGEEYDFSIIMEERDYNDINIRNNINSIVRRFKVAGFTHKTLIYTL